MEVFMYIGIDIGGTKCAVVKAEVTSQGEIKILEKRRFATSGANSTLESIFDAVKELMPCDAIGISSGGPLDEKRGVIMSPPNLPGWDEIKIVDMIKERFGVPVKLMNDANACALAEWRFGAGRGTRNMVFLTFGTGLGAGLILDGKLYSGTNGNAGELGHIRLFDDGPVGFGKVGSFEGFCSGGGISKLAEMRKKEAKAQGREIFENGCDAKTVADLAYTGDADAIAVYKESAKALGRGLSVIVDAFNPERIVIGSVFARSQDLFTAEMERVMNEEALAESLSVCRVVPAELGDSIGDFAAVAVAEMTVTDAPVLSFPNEHQTKYTNALRERYPQLEPVLGEIREAIFRIVRSYNNGGKILLCGNGGSAADCEHISGEFLKGFLMKRAPHGEELDVLSSALGADAELLQSGVPAIPLPSLTASLSAFANDVSPELVYAQLVYALGRRGDVLVAISTSGNSKNVVLAAKCAGALGIDVIALVGGDGGELSKLADTVIRAPEYETFKIQEYHLPIYHAICSDVEEMIFKNE